MSNFPLCEAPVLFCFLALFFVLYFVLFFFFSVSDLLWIVQAI